MLTLITGTPGAGKTAWTVQELTRLPAQRKLYVHGIPELKIAHEPIYCLSELCEHCREKTHIVDVEANDQYYQQLEELQKPGVAALMIEDWPDWASHGSLIVIDEVQRVWRPSSSKLPDEVAALETHRHKGLDFWLISQGPHLFHANIRLLIGRHVHLVSTWKGRTEYEFSECRQNVTSRTDAVVRPYRLPKKIFSLYKSSSLHTSVNHRKPLSLYLLILTLFVVLGLGYHTYQRFNERVNPEMAKADGEARAQAVAPASAESHEIITNQLNEEFPDFKPVIEGVPESAPAYHHLIKVTSVPLLAGCVRSTAKGCQCFTNQATPYHTTELYCNEVVDGHRFNPYLSDHQQTEIQIGEESGTQDDAPQKGAEKRNL